ncbi:histidine kinase [Polymorphobacter multimanifer]|uniref:histidine kinase n=1 Tax=Polymorphobacter multimanifer TaxID=1070431 RepID=A0A841LD71_9SPHN|nr:ATP-binding protein [Polymorphobacter multimanifer]MBB6227092.1 two-component system sensor histidine kinase ChvG [Polymorphobacter multimanifer]GGI70561.1 histidine kinase [Polymorphobacter multimanifer]
MERPPLEVQEWRRGLGFGSLRARIFAVNIIAVLAFAIMLLYIDTVRARLLDERTAELAQEAATIASLAASLPAAERVKVLESQGFARGTRLRLYAADGALLADNWRRPGTSRFVIDNPDDRSWRRRSALFIDRALERLARIHPPTGYAEALPDRGDRWPEIAAASPAEPATRLRRAADGSLVLAAAARLPGKAASIHLTDSAEDLSQIVRAERLASFWLLIIVTIVTVTLSAYLARTIVRPLRMLAIAAHRVRLGRSREVVVPRLPERRDEIGALARALSDMSTALRGQIDATEAFAADVAHELKNPLASLRSAVDTLGQIEAPDLRARLMDVILDDVARIDRLITDISDASRLDAELSRSRFESIDAAALAAGLVEAYSVAPLPRGVSIAMAPASGPAMVEGEPARLAQVLRNLIDNALSFSPDGGKVELAAEADGALVRLSVTDQGPGVPPENRSDVFTRFYSQRPEAEDYGRHSGLGLSIVASIVVAHGGRIEVTDPPGGKGAAFIVSLPAA